MLSRIKLPEEFDRRDVQGWLGDEGCNAMRWALNSGWIQSYKSQISKREGYDVGVPATVDCMLHAAMFDVSSKHYEHVRDVLNSELSRLTKGVRAQKTKELRTLMIEGYLLGTDFHMGIMPAQHSRPAENYVRGLVRDEHGTNQMEGELKRYWARKQDVRDPLGNSVNPSGIDITSDLIDDYCDTHKLSTTSEKRFAKHLGIKYS